MAFDQLQSGDPRLHWGITKSEILKKLWQQRGITGKGIRVGILDSGIIPTHPGLRLTPEVVSDFSAGAVGSADAHHGAWCAGVVAADGAQVFGVAPEAKLAYGKVKVSSSSIAAGVEWLTAVKPAVHIISISLELFEANASPVNFEKLRVAIATAIGKGKIVVAAVGNEANANPADIVQRFPAAFPGVIAVGAIKGDFSIHEESGRNASLDLLAPGHSLLTTPADAGIKSDFGRTSAATAFAAGAIALVLQSLKINKKKMNPAELEALLKATASFPFPNAVKCQSSLFGCGIINPVAAVEKIEASVVPASTERSATRSVNPKIT